MVTYVTTTTPVTTTRRTAKVQLQGSMYNGKRCEIVNIAGDYADVYFPGAGIKDDMRSIMFPVKYLIFDTDETAAPAVVNLDMARPTYPTITQDLELNAWYDSLAGQHGPTCACPDCASDQWDTCPGCGYPAQLNGDAICFECSHAEPEAEPCSDCGDTECTCRRVDVDHWIVEHDPHDRADETHDGR
jgi:hypothetical protein